MLCHMIVFFFKQKTAYEMRISDWSSDVCSSDLVEPTTWQALPAMLLVERSGFGLNELLDRAPITGTAACLEQQAAASIAEEKSPRPKYGRSSRCDQDRSRSLARTPRDHCVCKRKNARTT